MIVLDIALSFLFFFLAISFSFYLPGIAILHLLARKLSHGAKHILAWVVGYCVFILMSYIGAWIHVEFLPFIAIVIAGIYCLLRRKEIFIFKKNKNVWSVVLLIVFGSLAFTSMSFLSGLVTERGFQFIGSDNGTDAIMHVARIKSQTYLFPPQYTGFYGYAMRGYHYFYDFLLSRFVVFYHFSAEDLYYRLFPFFLSLLYGATLYLLSGFFTKRNIDKLLILFFAYFGASFGYVLSFFTHTVNAGSGMGLVQQLELILDPSVIFSAAILFGGFYFLLQKKTLANAVLTGCIIGLLAQLKIYAGIIGLGTLIIYSVYLVFRERLWKYAIIANCVAIFLTAITYLPNNFGIGHFIWSPFFLYENLLKQPLFNQFHFEVRMLLYRQSHKIFHLWMMNVIGFVLFWILALGTRIVFLVAVTKVLQKKFWTDERIVLGVAICIPLIIASFFIQSLLLFDTVQFLWMMAIFISIPVGIFYGKLWTTLPQYGKYLLLLVLIFFSFGEFYFNEDIYFLHPQYTAVSSLQMTIVKTIQQKVPQKGYIVVAPAYITNRSGKKEFQYYPAPLFASLTGRQTYYEYEIPEFLDTQKVTTRKNEIQQITLSAEKCDGNTVRSIIKKIGTPYLVTLSVFRCKSIPHMQKIEEEENWTFWKVQ